MKNLTFTIIALLTVLAVGWITISENKRNELKNDIKQLKQDNLRVIDSLKKEIYVKDSIVMDCEGVLMNKKDAIRFKQIYFKS